MARKQNIILTAAEIIPNRWQTWQISSVQTSPDRFKRKKRLWTFFGQSHPM